MFNKYSLYLHRPWEPLKTKNLSLLCMINRKTNTAAILADRQTATINVVKNVSA